MLVHLGVDSTDSLTQGMCTTYAGTVIAQTLLQKGVTFTDYPNLIRLNPNIPYKTRGNGAVALRVEASPETVDDIMLTAQKTVEKLAIFSDPQTNPGIAVHTGNVPDILHEFYERALHEVLTVEDAFKTAERVGAHLYGYKNKMGVIGALASIGETLKHDHTYELLVYRKEENWGKERFIDAETVIEMDRKIEDVFFNYDYEENTVCIAPHTVCPVLAGIRGETAESVKKGLSLVDLGEPFSTYAVFRTNQHTNLHFEKASSVSAIRDYSSVILEGTVMRDPFTIQGGHVFFEVENQGQLMCAAFEPTKSFRDAVRALVKGDRIRVYGGVKPGGPEGKRALNLERLDIVALNETVLANPTCPQCGKSMTSKGKGKGFQCKKCKIRKREKELIQLDRTLEPGTHEPPPSAWRHLYKMNARERTNSGNDVKLIEGWIGLER